MDPSTCGGTRVFTFQVITIVIAAIGFLYLIFILSIIKKIRKGIGLIQKASHITETLSQLKLFPFFVSFITLCVCSLSFLVSIYAMTVGEIQLERAKSKKY